MGTLEKIVMRMINNIQYVDIWSESETLDTGLSELDCLTVDYIDSADRSVWLEMPNLKSFGRKYA